MTDAINYEKREFTSFKRLIHLLYWINSCTGGRLNLHSYSRKYPEAMTLVENNYHSADKSSKDFSGYYTVEEQSAALRMYFDRNILLAKRGLETENSGMRKKFKSP